MIIKATDTGDVPYYQVGDTIEITKEMIDGKPKEVKKRLGYILVDAVSNFGELSGDATEFWVKELPEKILPIQVKLHAERMDRFRVAMMCEWVGVTKKYKTNTMLLEELGFRFDYSCLEKEPIPIEKCDDEYLTEKEIVVKYYAKEYGLSIKEAFEEIDKVVNVMSKNGIVFYRP